MKNNMNVVSIDSNEVPVGINSLIINDKSVSYDYRNE